MYDAIISIVVFFITFLRCVMKFLNLKVDFIENTSPFFTLEWRSSNGSVVIMQKFIIEFLMKFDFISIFHTQKSRNQKMFVNVSATWPTV